MNRNYPKVFVGLHHPSAMFEAQVTSPLRQTRSSSVILHNLVSNQTRGEFTQDDGIS